MKKNLHSIVIQNSWFRQYLMDMLFLENYISECPNIKRHKFFQQQLSKTELTELGFLAHLLNKICSFESSFVLTAHGVSEPTVVTLLLI